MKHIFAFGLLLTSVLAAAPQLDAQERVLRPTRVLAARGWIGISMNPEQTAEQERRSGVEIRQVSPNSPAARAGVRGGDRILRVNGQAATRAGIEALQLAPGDTVRLRTRRGRQEQNVVVVAAPRSYSITIRGVPGGNGNVTVIRVDSLQALVHDQLRSADTIFRRLDRQLRSDSVRRRLERVVVRADSLGRLRAMGRDSIVVIGPESIIFNTGLRAVAGAEFTEVNPELGRYFGVSHGLLATRVSEGTPAARSGLRSGDVITAAGGRPVRNVADLRMAVRQAGDGKQVRLSIMRQSAKQELNLRW
jgi:S1-C subfamily serine protease